MKLASSLFLISIALALPVSRAQNPMVVVQAATPAPAVSTVTAPTPTPPESNFALIKLLQEMKATNAETLKKQEAVLQQLDEISQAAEQLKAFASRS